jgi:hypothetical protein
VNVSFLDDSQKSARIPDMTSLSVSNRCRCDSHSHSAGVIVRHDRFDKSLNESSQRIKNETPMRVFVLRGSVS